MKADGEIERISFEIADRKKNAEKEKAYCKGKDGIKVGKAIEKMGGCFKTIEGAKIIILEVASGI